MSYYFLSVRWWTLNWIMHWFIKSTPDSLCCFQQCPFCVILYHCLYTFNIWIFFTFIFFNYWRNIYRLYRKHWHAVGMHPCESHAKTLLHTFSRCLPTWFLWMVRNVQPWTNSTDSGSKNSTQFFSALGTIVRKIGFSLFHSIHLYCAWVPIWMYPFHAHCFALCIHGKREQGSREREEGVTKGLRAKELKNKPIRLHNDNKFTWHSWVNESSQPGEFEYTSTIIVLTCSHTS